MKTFIISLERSSDRRESIKRQFKALSMEYEFIDAVDGMNLDDAQVRELTAPSFYHEYKTKPWITEGVVAAALSHRIAYQKIVDQNLDYALILEDDVIISADFPAILKNIVHHLQPSRLISFFCQTYERKSPIYFKKNTSVQVLSEYSLFEPVTLRNVGSAAAYIMSNYTAKRNIRTQTPIISCPDWWVHFNNTENFVEFRLIYPLALNPGEFETTINYESSEAISNIFWNFIKKIPFIQSHIDSRRISQFGHYVKYKFI